MSDAPPSYPIRLTAGDSWAEQVLLARVPCVGEQVTTDRGTFVVLGVRHFPVDWAGVAASIVCRAIDPRTGADF